MTGTVLGTAGYLSPEQAQGDRTTPASDRYALAVVAFELLSGRRPFENESMTAEAAAHVNAQVPSISEICESLPPEVDPMFRKAMAKDPNQRFETAADFVASLRAALAEAAGTTRSLRPVAAAPQPASADGAPPQRPMRRRRGVGGWVLLAALLSLGAVGGAIAAILLTRDDGKQQATPQPQARTIVRTVTRQGSTEQVTVTQPAPPPPSPPPSSPPPAVPPAAGSLSGRQLNDAGYAKQQAGDYNGALPLLRQAVQKLQGTGPGDPYEGYANYNLGYTLYKLGRCSAAMPYIERAKQLEPSRHEPKDLLKLAKQC
jgi:serine/threonine-protein kinase